MPVRNGKATIEKAIQSIIAQQYANLELIVIDGESTDGTVDIIKKYSDHIAYWQSRKDGNPTNAMNLGIEKATGDLVGILMADDWYEIGLFAAIAKCYASHPDVDVFTCGGRIVTYDAVTKKEVVKRQYQSSSQMDLTIRNICFRDISAICCRFIKRSLYQTLGLYQAFDKHGDYLFSNDKEFLLRASLKNIKQVTIPMIGHNYLAHEGSSTFGGNKNNLLRMFTEHMLIAEKFLATPLSPSHRWQLKYWINDQASRLMVYHLLDKNFRSSIIIGGKVWKYNPIIFPISFCLTTFRIVTKKLLAFPK